LGLAGPELRPEAAGGGSAPATERTLKGGPAVQLTAPGPTLSVADVIRLVRADVANTVIVGHIRRHCLAAPLTTDDLILLTRSGAGATVISALQDLPLAANSRTINGNDTRLDSSRDKRDGSEEPNE
jgi:hypothetical protein